MSKVSEPSYSELSIFSETTKINREEPKQLLVETPKTLKSIEAVEEKSAKQQTEELIVKFQDYIKAATEVQKLIGDQIQDRKVIVNAQKNPAVRDAIRRLFGTDTEVITYEMFKKCLEWRSELILESRKKTYGAVDGITRN